MKQWDVYITWGKRQRTNIEKNITIFSYNYERYFFKFKTLALTAVFCGSTVTLLVTTH